MSCHNRIFHFICLYKPNITSPIKSHFFAVNIENLVLRTKAAASNIHGLTLQRWSCSRSQLQALHYWGLVGFEHQKQLWDFHGTTDCGKKTDFLSMLVDGKTEMGWDSASSIYLRSALLRRKVGNHGHSLSLLPCFSITESSFMETCDELPVFCLCKDIRAAQGERLIFCKEDPKLQCHYETMLGSEECLKTVEKKLWCSADLHMAQSCNSDIDLRGFNWSILDKFRCTKIKE